MNDDIDRLYQLPLSEFTAERDALAKRSSGDSAAIRKLQKPTAPAWVVNQLYWKQRKVFDRLAAASDHRGAPARATIELPAHPPEMRLRGSAEPELLPEPPYLPPPPDRRPVIPGQRTVEPAPLPSFGQPLVEPARIPSPRQPVAHPVARPVTRPVVVR